MCAGQSYLTCACALMGPSPLAGVRKKRSGDNTESLRLAFEIHMVYDAYLRKR